MHVAQEVSVLRRCLGHFATGVTVVTYFGASAPDGVTVNSFTSVSLDPPLVLICLDKRSKAIPLIVESRFAINVLSAGQRDIARHFGGRPLRDMGAEEWRYRNGIPHLSQSLALLICEPESKHDGGDHDIIVARVADFEVASAHPLCFFKGEFVDLLPHP
jgi:flavin reductase (DIM6/NTAB) family NADH-FMN oxidoreductase RutF